MNLNKAMIIGNLTRDPEVRTTPSGQTVASFSVATNFSWTDANGQRQQKAEFHNVVAWRKLGEICGTYLKKGKQVYIEGRLQTRDWVGQDGAKRNRTEIIADNMIMLGSAAGQPAGAYSAPMASPRPAGAPAPMSEEIPTIDQEVPATFTAAPEEFSAPSETSGEEEIKVENIPF
ncbi:MAG: single-stranded DNA-binding protein [Patescibacteria group bacterium]